MAESQASGPCRIRGSVADCPCASLDLGIDGGAVRRGRRERICGRPLAFTETPPKQTNSTSADFKWTGTPPYKCSLDGATPATCKTPDVLPGLSEGPHSFSVEEGGGGVPVEVEYGWTVDLTPPTTVVTEKPPPLSNSTTATFAFNSPDTTATFRCSLNGAPPQPCTSPVIYTGLADATRTLLIQAVDPAGNVDTQAQPITWTVDTTPPDTVLADRATSSATPTRRSRSPPAR